MSPKAWRSFLIAGTLCLLFWCAVAAAVSQAKIGIAHGVGPHLSNPLTPHIGRVYYKPGDKATRKLSATARDDASLDRIIARLEGVKQHVTCAKLHAQYASRHGLATPRPLKGYHGCAKYARDEGYWKTRRGERAPVSNPFSQLKSSAHNAVVDSVPYQMSGIFSLTNWNHF